jgi:hypothetical protein
MGHFARGLAAKKGAVGGTANTQFFTNNNISNASI